MMEKFMDPSKSHRSASTIRWSVGLLSLFGLMSIGLPNAFAQNFKSEKVDPSIDRYAIDRGNAAMKKRRSEILNKFKKGNSRFRSTLDAKRIDKGVQDWVLKVRMNEMASSNPSALKDLGRNRADLVSRLNAYSGNGKDALLKSVVDKAATIATENYHPAARINAVRLMAMLQDRTQRVFTSGGGAPPVYNKAALNKVLEIAEDPKSPMFLKAACLNGLYGVAKIDGQVQASRRIDSAIRGKIVDFSMKMLNDQGSDLMEGTVNGHLARRAVKVLGDLNLATTGDPKSEKADQVKAALQKVADNDKAGIWLRFDAMDGLYKLGVEKPQNFAKDLGKLVVLVSKVEAHYIQGALAQANLRDEIKKNTRSAKVGGGNRSRNNSKGGGGKGGEMGSIGGGSLGGGQFSSAGSTDAELYQGKLLPFHLRRVRVNVKNAVAIARRILGATRKAKSGLKADFPNDAELDRLVTDIAGSLDNLVVATDIGLDVRRKGPKKEEDSTPLGGSKQNQMKDKGPFERVPFEIEQEAMRLEKIVGKVSVPTKPKTGS